MGELNIVKGEMHGAHSEGVGKVGEEMGRTRVSPLGLGNQQGRCIKVQLKCMSVMTDMSTRSLCS